MKRKVEIGLSSFGDYIPNPKTNEIIPVDVRIRQIVDEIVLADKVDLDFYGLGEHHRDDYAVSAPHMILAAAASLTSHIKLSSAVTVLSSEDPVRVYQNFATLQALSNGRAEIMAGRGSFIESFPLFGQDLKDYDELFNEKLELLLKIRDNEIVTHEGIHRASIDAKGIYPRTIIELPISLAVGGTPASAARAGKLGLPLFLAIIGGNPNRFKTLVDLYKKTYKEYGHDPKKMFISAHSHGHIGLDSKKTQDALFENYSTAMNKIGMERGWSKYNKMTYDYNVSLDGALYVGDPQYVADKIIKVIEQLDLDRFVMHVPMGYMEHVEVLNTITLLGTKVKPIIDKYFNK